MSRDLNKVLLIGNLTHDPDVRMTPSGRTVCGFRLATKRTWTGAAGNKEEQTQYHRVVAFGQLGEICGKYLKKSRRVYLEGRLSNREYTKDDEKRAVTEIVADDMILLDAKPNEGPSEAAVAVASSLGRAIEDEEALAREIPF